MMKLRLMTLLFSSLTLWAGEALALEDACTLNQQVKRQSLTVPVSVQLPTTMTSVSVGTVLYKKEQSLAQLTGTHRPILPVCIKKNHQTLVGRISSAQRGKNIWATSLPGLGVRITVIYDKPGMPHKEWLLPFNAVLDDVTQKELTTEDIKLRFEAIKTGPIEGGTFSVKLPSLLTLSDNSLVVNLALTVIAAKAHCSILIPQPQIDLTPIDAKELLDNRHGADWPVSVNLQCLNTQHASINIEGVYAANTPTVFANVATDTPAKGVGIEMAFNGIVMQPGHPVDIAMPQQQMGFPLPLSVRYARTEQSVSEGKVKAQITLHINYL